MHDLRGKSQTLKLEASECGGCKRVKVVGVGGWVGFMGGSWELESGLLCRQCREQHNLSLNI